MVVTGFERYRRDMTSEPLRDVTDEEIRAFHRDGAVAVRGILPSEWVDLVESGADAAIAEPDPMSQNLGSLRVDQFPAAKSPALRRVVDESPIAAIVGRALDSPVRFYMDQLFYKPKGHFQPTAWHQDTCYYNLEGQDLIRAWVSPDPVPRNVSLEVVRGSHLWNVTYSPLAGRDPEADDVAREMVENAQPDRPMLGIEAHDEWNYFSGVRDGRLPPVPNIEAHRDSYDILGWDYEPGDVILFHGHVLHGAGGNVDSPNPRRAHATLWAGADVRYLHRVGQIIPDPRALYAHEPRTGQPLSDFPDVFPVAWSP
jgi:ectoine hydroxylase-related dioxygenase (phytanoyl-CoA dioxygenase family)